MGNTRGKYNIPAASAGGAQKLSAHTKATLQVPLQALLKEISPEMIEVVKNFNSYVWRTEVLEISSDKGRRQTANLNSCYQKLDGSLMQVANDVVAKEARNHEAADSRKDR